VAKAVTPVSADDAGTWRWSMRTGSIRDTTAALSKLWVRVAQGARGDAAASGAAASGAAVDEDEPIRLRTRTSVLTLVVVAPRPEVVERALAVVAMLAARHPSRAIVLSPTDPDGPSAFEAHVHASCQLPERASSEICTEEILIKLGGELAQHLASTVAPLLIHDLPVVLWWPDDVPFGRADFAELAGECDRLFVDSGHFRGDGLARLLSLADAVEGGLVVHDVSWLRQMLWRELLATCFDHPLLMGELKRLTTIRVDVAKPGAHVRLSRAVLFVGWLMSRLGLSVSEPLRARADGSWAASLRTRGRDVSVLLRPVEVEYSGAARAAGSMVRVELEAGGAEAHTVVNITRQADHLRATADWNGAPVTRRASKLERFDEAPYLAEALDRTSHERLFAQALGEAVALIGQPHRG
jgi:glucose-6-phosphate dehydrogenase assembly protein OpcA